MTHKQVIPYNLIGVKMIFIKINPLERGKMAEYQLHITTRIVSRKLCGGTEAAA